MEPGERPAVAIAVSTPPRFWTVVTHRGYVKRLVRVACDQRMDRQEPLLTSPLRNDEPAAMVSGDQSDLLVATRWGRAVRFAQRAVETQGSTVLDLEPDDQVVAALAMDSGNNADRTEIVLATASGYGMRRSSADVPMRTHLGSGGKTLIQAHDVLAVFDYPLAPRAVHEPGLLFVTYGGSLVFVPTRELGLCERLSKGTLLHDMSHDPAIAVTMVQ
jgi:DNA gyrase/topoisomerase IV subunit A